MSEKLTKKQEKLMKLLHAGKKREAFLLLDKFTGAELDFKDDTNSFPLAEATRKGWVSLVKKMIDKGADVTMKNEHGSTALVMALSLGKRKTAALLAKREKEIGYVSTDTKSGLSLLMYAAASGNRNLVADYVSDNTVNEKNKRGATALMIASSCEGSQKVVAELLKNKYIKINEQDDNGFTALHNAIENGQTNTALLLMRKGAKTDIKNRYKQTPLDLAIEEGNVAVFKAIIKKDSKKSSFNKEAIQHKILVSDSVRILETAVKSKFINLKDKNVVATVSENFLKGNISSEKLNMLKKNGFDETDLIASLLKEAASGKDKREAVWQLNRMAENGIDLSKGLSKALKDKTFNFKAVQKSVFSGKMDKIVCTLAKNGQIKAIKALSAAGVDLNCTDEKGRTPVMLAILNGKVRTLNALIKEGADINKRDMKGNSALMYALTRMPKHHKKGLAYVAGIDEKRRQSALALIEAGADVKACNKDGATILMYAASFGSYEVFNEALAHGADINATDNKGYTVAAYAHSVEKDGTTVRLHKEAIMRKIVAVEKYSDKGTATHLAHHATKVNAGFSEVIRPNDKNHYGR